MSQHSVDVLSGSVLELTKMRWGRGHMPHRRGGGGGRNKKNPLSIFSLYILLLPSPLIPIYGGMLPTTCFVHLLTKNIKFNQPLQTTTSPKTFPFVRYKPTGQCCGGCGGFKTLPHRGSGRIISGYWWCKLFRIKMGGQNFGVKDDRSRSDCRHGRRPCGRAGVGAGGVSHSRKGVRGITPGKF